MMLYKVFIIFLADGTIGVYSLLAFKHDLACCSVATNPAAFLGCDKSLPCRKFATPVSSAKGWPTSPPNRLFAECIRIKFKSVTKLNHSIMSDDIIQRFLDF